MGIMRMAMVVLMSWSKLMLTVECCRPPPARPRPWSLSSASVTTVAASGPSPAAEHIPRFRHIFPRIKLLFPISSALPPTSVLHPSPSCRASPMTLTPSPPWSVRNWRTDPCSWTLEDIVDLYTQQHTQKLAKEYPEIDLRINRSSYQT